MKVAEPADGCHGTVNTHHFDTRLNVREILAKKCLWACKAIELWGRYLALR